MFISWPTSPSLGRRVDKIPGDIEMRLTDSLQQKKSGFYMLVKTESSARYIQRVSLEFALEFIIQSLHLTTFNYKDSIDQYTDHIMILLEDSLLYILTQLPNDTFLLYSFEC